MMDATTPPCSSPFKGEVGRGMGSVTSESLIPTPALPLKGRGFHLREVS